MPRVKKAQPLSMAEVEKQLRTAEQQKEALEQQKEMLEMQKAQLQYAKHLHDVAAKLLANALKEADKHNLNYRDLAQEILSQALNEDAAFLRNGYDY